MKGSPETRAWNSFDKGKSPKVASQRVVTLIPKAQRSMIRKSPKTEITQHLSPRLLPISLFFFTYNNKKRIKIIIPPVWSDTEMSFFKVANSGALGG